MGDIIDPIPMEDIIDTIPMEDTIVRTNFGPYRRHVRRVFVLHKK
jgi:hypothetical protein